MLYLSQKQYSAAQKRDDDAFVAWVAHRLKTHFPAIDEPDEPFIRRLQAALDYAKTLPLRGERARRDFLLLESFFPDFYRRPAVDKWLRTPNGYTADQRLEDLKHLLINRQRRGL